MRKPRVSIITTAKNEENYIEKCLRSVRAQTFRDFEIVICDTKSTDRTVRIARKYADKVIVRECNVADGRNIGAKAASGGILLFVDADTVLLPDTIENLMRAFDKRNVVGATGPVLPLTAESRYVGTYIFFNKFVKVSIKVGRPQVLGAFCAYRRDAFEAVGGFDGGVGILEDFHLSRRISRLGKIRFVDDAMVLTSHRRLKEWGIRAPERYIRAWLKMSLRGRSYSHEWYKPIR